MAEESNKPERQSWKKEMGTFYSTKNIRPKERLAIWCHGRNDGRKGLVEVDDEGKVTSPYCNQLAQLANKRIAAEWQACGNDVLAIQPYLDKLDFRYEGALYGLDSAAKAADASVADAQLEAHKGDDGVSDSTLERRKAFRAAKASAGHRATQQRCKAELDAIAEESAEALDDYLAREEIAMMHEMMIEYEYAQKIDIFMRAAKPYLDDVALDFHTEPLASKPRNDYFANHPRYDFKRHIDVA